MATETINYGLTKPDDTDFYDIMISNNNADVVDAQMKRNADAAAYYGTCSTAAAVSAKTFALSGFALKSGARIVVTFTNGNTTLSPTLNVNGTGAYAIRKDGVAAGSGAWNAGATIEFVYTTSTWTMVSTPMTLYNGVDSTSTTQAPTANAVKMAYDKASTALAAAMYYGVCNNDSLIAAKTVNCSNFTLVAGARIAVTFAARHNVEAPTLNVNGTGAIPIYKDGNGIGSSGAWASGATIEFVYDGTYWRMIS